MTQVTSGEASVQRSAFRKKPPAADGASERVQSQKFFAKNLIDPDNKGLIIFDPENKGLSSRASVQRFGVQHDLHRRASERVRSQKFLQKNVIDPENKGLKKNDPENKGLTRMILRTKDLAEMHGHTRLLSEEPLASLSRRRFLASSKSASIYSIAFRASIKCMELAGIVALESID